MDKAKAKQHHRNAQQMSFQEKTEEMYQEIDQAILLDPDNPEYLWFRVWKREADMKTGRYPLSKAGLILEDLDKILALETDPKEIISAHLWRSVIYNMISDFDNFMVEIDWLIQHSNKPSAYIRKADVSFQYKHYEQALTTIETGLNLLKDPIDVADAMTVKLKTLYYLKRYKQMIKDIDDYLQRTSKKGSIFYYWRGFALYELGKKKEALEDFNRFLNLSKRRGVRDVNEFFRMFPKPKK